MGNYENIAIWKTEKELLELWKAKEPVTGSYMEKKQEKTVSINHKNIFISDGIVNEKNEHNTELFNNIAVVNLKKVVDNLHQTIGR